VTAALKDQSPILRRVSVRSDDFMEMAGLVGDSRRAVTQVTFASSIDVKIL